MFWNQHADTHLFLVQYIIYCNVKKKQQKPPIYCLYLWFWISNEQINKEDDIYSMQWLHAYNF